ncbi:MAG: cell envelope integrity protein CreD [Chitinophagaceae bacterium]|nr:cell envelope integrity protein CreD [Chitinophagaceae bacterium]MBP6590543.1 cell envelope integrity protein CreD [Chitinophagaceae bacterium]
METQSTTPTEPGTAGTIIQSIWDKGKLFMKAVIIFVMALFLWLPTTMIMNMVRERESRQREAIADISSKWAGRQTVMTPVLMVPYTESSQDAKGVISTVKKNAYFLAGNARINATVHPEKRYRGIYQVIVYHTDLSISGSFGPLAYGELKIPAASLLWEEAALLFKVTDNLKGINEDVRVQWNDSSHSLLPQPLGASHFEDALMAVVPMSLEKAGLENKFQLKFSLNGSEQLLFAALARETSITMQSTWSSPSFTGIKLPDSRELNDSGFTAKWRYLNRSMPLVWKNTVYPTEQSAMGADLVIAVDSYDKTLRSVKYALLCIILTFASFFLIETIYRRPLHLLQYGLAGLALVLFYTLLLSISEYTSFNLAYLLAAVSTISLVAWYVGSIMRSGKLAAFISLVLGVVYAYIFSIIQLQDYSLLMGSIGLFVALAIIMYFSRKLQWS